MPRCRHEPGRWIASWGRHHGEASMDKEVLKHSKDPATIFGDDLRREIISDFVYGYLDENFTDETVISLMPVREIVIAEFLRGALLSMIHD